MLFISFFDLNFSAKGYAPKTMLFLWRGLNSEMSFLYWPRR